LLLQQLNRRDEAQAALQHAFELQPQDTDIVYALVVFYTQGEDWARALGQRTPVTAAGTRLGRRGR
jgi:hypothetical protein